MEIPLVGGHFEGRSPNIAPETCVNWFYEKNAGGESLVPTPGASLFSQLSGEIRGCIDYDGKPWFVAADTLYSLDASGTSTAKGTLNTSNGRVSMAHNGTRAGANQQIMIVDGSSGYIYDNVADTLSEITDPDFVTGTSLTFIDGYFVWSQKDSDRFWISSLYDGTAIDPADFSTAEGAPDRIQGVIADRRELYLFGEKTLEVWYNAGDPDNTFQRFQGGFSQCGAVGDTPAKFDNSIAWLKKNDRGQGEVVILADSYQPKIISTPEVNYQMSTYTIDDAFSYAYQSEGHEFYVITFPTNDVTWVYDASTQVWHQRAHAEGTRERYNCHTFSMGKHLFGDFENGKIYQLDNSLGTFDGSRIPRERTTALVTEEEKRARISSVQLDMEEGIGDPNANDTGMWLSYSKDGGHTYSNEVERSAGEGGQYSLRVIWRRLGFARNWIFKIRTWSPNRPILKGLYARLYGE